MGITFVWTLLQKPFRTANLLQSAMRKPFRSPDPQESSP